MKSASHWILVFKVCLSLIFALSSSRPLVAAQNNEHPNTVLANDNSGYIGIDCGADEDYFDGNKSISYQSDSRFVPAGENHNISSSNSYGNYYFERQLRTLRSFPAGKRNCYTLKPEEGKDKYHITALFGYGNYDNNDKTPAFDVYMGVNYWHTLQINRGQYLFLDAIYVASADTIGVCLVSTDNGTPFISLLELRLFRNLMYDPDIDTQLVDLMERANLGMFERSGDDFLVRYTDDIYSRVWDVWYMQNENVVPFNTSTAFSINGINDAYKLPRAVLSTAVRAMSRSASLDVSSLKEKGYDTSYEYMVYLHFFEFEEEKKKRIMNITINGEGILSKPLTLTYWKPETIRQKVKLDDGHPDIQISITSTSESDLPAMLNAYEIYRVVPQPNPTTAQEDVDAMLDIKRIYGISKVSWQGDPCVPEAYAWEGLICSSGDTPRVTSLDLSWSNLTGQIATSFFNLTKLESLILSNNELTGEVPEFLSKLPNLHTLNLAMNKFKGSIPKALMEKYNNKSIMISWDGNPGLCEASDSCSSSKYKYVIPSAVVGILIIITFSSLMIWRLKRKNPEVTYRKDEQMISKRRVFTYAEIVSITNNFETKIGEGGFGKVYLGALQDSRKVAVKLLKNSSLQGYKQFQSEAQLLMVVHHKNLVPLVGYCDESDKKALVYEYMTMGNLEQQLSDKSRNVLTWKMRLQIALDAAYGLDYLHNGCKPPIVHRDLKTSNILLNDNMQAKIADFGLSRAFEQDIDTHIMTDPAGTFGYLDPEFHNARNPNKKSDVYSFGVILLELLTGQPAIIKTQSGDVYHILQWITPKLESRDIQTIVDWRLQETIDPASAWKFLEIVESCTPSTAIQRPDIAQIVLELKDCLTLVTATEMTGTSNSKSNNSLHTSVSQLELETEPHVNYGALEDASGEGSLGASKDVADLTADCKLVKGTESYRS